MVATEAPENDLQERTKTFAMRVVHLQSALPQTVEAQIPAKQVLRSGTSVGANYREASRARGKPAFISKCGDSLKEVEETAYWLELLIEGDLMLRRGSPLCGRNAMS